MGGSTISGTVNQSVTLGAGGYADPLTITATGTVHGTNGKNYDVIAPGSVGSIGVSATLSGSGSPDVLNNGVITGGAGGGYYGTNHAFAGGAGAYLGAGIFINNGRITGGMGGGVVAPGSGGVGVTLAGGVFQNNGTISGGAGGLSEFGNLVGATGGALLLHAGTFINAGLVNGAVSFSNGAASAVLGVSAGGSFSSAVSATGNSGAVLELTGTTAFDLAGIGSSFTNFNTLAFAAGATGTLAGNSAGLAAGQLIEGFAFRDTIDLIDFAATSETFNANNGLVLSNASGSRTLALQGNISLSNLSLSSDGSGGTNIIEIGSHTLSTNISTGITLTANGPYLSPFTVTATGKITSSQYGVLSNLAGATLTNYGFIRQSSSLEAVNFRNGGAAYNTSGATITSYNGIAFENQPGLVVNAGRITANRDGLIFDVSTGTVVNSGVIYGGYYGIVGFSSAGTVINTGSITTGVSNNASHFGIRLDLGGTITNGAGALIRGGQYGIFLDHNGSAGLVSNSGTLTGSSIAAYLGNGGYVTNASSGTISSSKIGLEFEPNAGTLRNAGHIAGSADGVNLTAGGNIYNNAGGIISGVIGVSLSGTGTILNAGTISGTTGAVLFTGTGADRLIISPGAVLSGAVQGNSTGSDALELTGGTGTGTISGIGSKYTGFGTLSLDANAQWVFAGNNALTGALNVASGATLTDTGALTSNFAVTNNGLITTDPSSIVFNSAVTGTGMIDIGVGSDVTFNASVASGQTIVFEGATGTLTLGDPVEFGATVTQFAAGDTLLLDGFVVNPAATTYVANTGLELTDTLGNHITLDIVEPANAATGNFRETAVPGGTSITYIACFAAGTRILRADGRQVAVEALAIGDALETQDGSAAEIIWLGRRGIDLTRHARPEAARPVLIAAGALGGGLPLRNLLVSPDHGMCLGDHLIPAKALTNGASIRQIDCDSVTYYHIELASHAVIFAEGAAAESYLDTGNRSAFENAEAAIILPPNFAQTQRVALGCLPFAEFGRVVEVARRRLLNLANIKTTQDPATEIRYEGGGATIASRQAVPGEINADPRDRRMLGIKITTIEIAGRQVPLDHPALTAGWHAMEPDGRWTNGAAVIPAVLLQGARALRLGVVATLDYPMIQQATSMHGHHLAAAE